MRPFANLDGLVRLSQNEGVDVRRPLLRVLTDLYVQELNHTREEEQQYVELALRLLPDVDTATRLVVARKLHAYPNAPAAVLDAILHATPEAETFLAAPAGTDVEAEYLGAASDAAAARSEEAPEAEDAAVEDVAASAPAAHQHQSPPLQEDAGEAFLLMSPRERAQLLQSLEDYDVPEGDVPLLPAPRLGARKQIERAALARNRADFAREVQLALGIPSRIAWRIAHDDSGELIVVAAKALDMRVDMLTRILLILNPAIGESVERVFTLTSLYERLLPEAILPIVAAWRGELASRSAARFRSVHADDGSSEALRLREIGRAARDDVSRRARTPGETISPLRRQDAS